MKKTKQFWLDLLERAASTYVEALIGLAIASGIGVPGADLLSIAQKAAVAALPAGLAVIKSGLATLRGNPEDASLLKAKPVDTAD